MAAGLRVVVCFVFFFFFSFSLNLLIGGHDTLFHGLRGPTCELLTCCVRPISAVPGPPERETYSGSSKLAPRKLTAATPSRTSSAWGVEVCGGGGSGGGGGGGTLRESSWYRLSVPLGVWKHPTR